MKSIYDEKSEEEKQKYVSIKDNLETAYGSIASNQLEWEDISSRMVSGTLFKSEDDRLEVEDVISSTSSIGTVTEPGILKSIIATKKNHLDKIPVVVESAISLGGDKDSIADKVKLDGALSFMLSQTLKSNIKSKVIEDAIKNGAGYLKVNFTKSGSVNRANLRRDIFLDNIEPGELIYNTKKRISEVDKLLHLKEITQDEFNSMNVVFRERYENAMAQLDEDNLTDEQKNVEVDVLEYADLYLISKEYSTSSDEPQKVDKLLRIIIIEDVVVEIEEYTGERIPFVEFRSGENELPFIDSDMWTVKDIYKEFVKEMTARSMMVSYSVHPQYEVVESMLPGVPMDILKALLTMPAAVIPTAEQGAIRKIDKDGDIRNITETAMITKNEIKETLGVNKTNLGQNSGSLTTSTGVLALMDAANGGIEGEVPNLLQFYEDYITLLWDIYKNNFSEFRFVNNENGTDKIDITKYEDVYIGLSYSNEQTNPQLAQKQLTNLIQILLQYDPEGQLELTDTIARLVEVTLSLMPLDEINKSKVKSSALDVITETSKSRQTNAFTEGAGVGADAASKAIIERIRRQG